MQNIKRSVALAYFSSFLLLLGSCSKEEPLDANLVKSFSIQSTYTGTTYPVYVVLPQNYQAGVKYRTIYMLDGDDALNGGKVYEAVGKLNQDISTSLQQQSAIVVAIGSTEDRIRDYAPTPLKMFGNQGGGIENYANFLEYELIPRIEYEFSVGTSVAQRCIAGHSLGGSFAGFMFAKRAHVFSRYLLLSPAFWWDDGIEMRYEEEHRSANVAKKTLVYVGCGQFEVGIAILAEEWYLRMKKYYPNCTTTFNKFKNRGHASSAYEDVQKALEFYYHN